MSFVISVFNVGLYPSHLKMQNSAFHRYLIARY
ncbi:hypothetical protein [Thalassotalea piscium]|nr:hypothetical protein [Thalassotalea piscium]